MNILFSQGVYEQTRPTTIQQNFERLKKGEQVVVDNIDKTAKLEIVPEILAGELYLRLASESDLVPMLHEISEEVLMLDSLSVQALLDILTIIYQDELPPFPTGFQFPFDPTLN